MVGALEKAGKAEHQCWWTESRFKNEIRHSQAGILDFSRSRRFGFWLLVFCFSLFDLIIAEISSSKFQSCNFLDISRGWISPATFIRPLTLGYDKGNHSAYSQVRALGAEFSSSKFPLEISGRISDAEFSDISSGTRSSDHASWARK